MPGFAALLPFAQFVLMAVPVNMQLGTAYTGGNRDEEKRATGVAGRMKRALDNHFEGLILFTIAVLVVVLGDARRVGFAMTSNGRNGSAAVVQHSSTRTSAYGCGFKQTGALRTAPQPDTNRDSSGQRGAAGMPGAYPRRVSICTTCPFVAPSSS